MRFVWKIYQRDFIRPFSLTHVRGSMTDTEDAVKEFLQEANTVYSEYDRGYMDADAALSRLESHVESLREQVE